MQKASATAQQIGRLCESNRDALFLPLAVAVHSFYARPFMHNNGVGSIGREIVPAEASGIHSWLMKFRLKAYCHTDSTLAEDTDIPWNDVVYEIEDGIKRITTQTPTVQVENYVGAVPHFEVMATLFFREIHHFHEVYADWIPKERGHYELQVVQSAESVFMPHIPRQHSVLNFE